MKAFILLVPFLFFLAGCANEPQEAVSSVPITVPDEVPSPPDISEPAEAESESSAVEPVNLNDNYSSAEGLHWTHMPVTYSISNEEECGSYESRKIGRAFDAVSSATNGSVYFEKVKADGDIVFSCSFLEGCYELVTEIDESAGVVYRYERICGHSKGVAKTTIRGNVILGSEIEMFGLAGFSETSGKGTSGFYVGSCGHPTTEIHEILHAFGYGHSNESASIMYYAEDSVGTVIQEEGACLGKRKGIDREIVESLVSAYG